MHVLIKSCHIRYLEILNIKGFELLKAHWKLTGSSSLDNVQFIGNCVESWNKKQAWFEFVSSNIAERDVGDDYIYSVIDEKYKVHLLKRLIQIIIDAINYNRSDLLNLKMCHSHFSYFNAMFQSESRILSDVSFQICDLMNGLVHILKLPIEIAIGLLVQGISYLENISKESMGLWCSHLSELLIDQHIDKVENISEAQFIIIAQHLEYYSYYEAAIKILVFLEHKIILKNEDRIHLEKCQSLLANLKDHVKLNPAYSTKFDLRYEPMLDSWVSCTPKPAQKKSIENADNPLDLKNGPFLIPKPKIAFSNPLSQSFSPDPLLGRSLVSKSFKCGSMDFHDGLSSSGEETPIKQKFIHVYKENTSPTLQIPKKRIPEIIVSPKRKNSKNFSIVTPLPRTNEHDELL